MNQALRDVAAAAVDPPAFTVGDEFQGAFSVSASRSMRRCRYGWPSHPRSMCGSASAGVR